MQKILVSVIALCMAFAFVACDSRDTSAKGNGTPENLQVDNLPEYFTEEEGKQYLILPISKSKVRIENQHKNYLENIDIELLKTAEEIITEKMSAYIDNPCFGLQIDSAGYLCLYVEWIVDINPPNVVTSENGQIIDSGCNIDHEHIFFRERITK